MNHGGTKTRIRWRAVGLLGLVVVLLAWQAPVLAVEVIPPSPRQYFNDYAGATSGGAAQQLNARLEKFERETSNQILVAIYPKMESDSSIEDYAVRVAQAWGVGQKARNNGAVLFVFVSDRRMYLQVGYGLEGALPDATARQIIDTVITPKLKQGDFAGGLVAGIDAIIAATKGEYKGTGQTVGQPVGEVGQSTGSTALVVLVIAIVVLMSIFRRSTGVTYGRFGYRSNSSWGGGFGGGGGGGFSGGGGSFGGGGAGGSW